MEQQTKMINGRLISYNDVIYHTTYSVFGFWDRLRILFGKELRVSSELYTKEPCSVLGSEAKAHVSPFIKEKNTRMVSIGNAESVNTQSV